jgi:uncharacterized DUF497 family protein
MDLEWNARKADANLRKHGVTFQEASTIFGDPLSITSDDPDHSIDERRYLAFGASTIGRCLAVSFTLRGDTIRLVSARLMTSRERNKYEQHRRK